MEEKKQDDLDLFYVMGRIKSAIIKFFNGIGRIIAFSVKHIVPISIFIAGGIVLALAVSLVVKPYYTTYLSLAHIRLNNEYCSEMVYNLNSHIDHRGNSGLAEVLRLSGADAQKVKRLRYKPLNENLSKLYNDSVSVLLPFKVEADVYDKSVLDTLQSAILHYMESNERATKLKRIDIQNFARTEEQLNKELLELDSLKLLVNKSIVPRGSGSGIILGEPIDPVNIYRRAMELFDRKIALKEKQEEIDSFEVIVGFNKGAKEAGPGKILYVLLGVLIGYLCGLFYTLRRNRGEPALPGRI